jgi:hypothetical protein
LHIFLPGKKGFFKIIKTEKILAGEEFLLIWHEIQSGKDAGEDPPVPRYRARTPVITDDVYLSPDGSRIAKWRDEKTVERSACHSAYLQSQISRSHLIQKEDQIAGQVKAGVWIKMCRLSERLFYREILYLRVIKTHDGITG